MENERKLAPQTIEILRMIADGASPRSVSDGCGCTMSYARELKRRYPDVIAELQGNHLDGTPLRFAPGHGAESIAHMEQPEPVQEEPAPEPEEPRKHSVAELFREIDKLKEENLKLKEDCAKAESERDEALDAAEHAAWERTELEKKLANANGKTAIDKGMIISILLDEINVCATESGLDFIRGMAFAIDRIIEGVADADAERTISS